MPTVPAATGTSSVVTDSNERGSATVMGMVVQPRAPMFSENRSTEYILVGADQPSVSFTGMVIDRVTTFSAAGRDVDWISGVTAIPPTHPLG
jgi:hypothetical protein